MHRLLWTGLVAVGLSGVALGCGDWYPGGMAVDGADVYWSDATQGAIWRISK